MNYEGHIMQVNIFKYGSYKSIRSRHTDLTQAIAFTLLQCQDNIYHIFINNDWKYKDKLSKFDNNPVTLTPDLNPNSATIVCADFGNEDQLKGLNKLYDDMLKNSKCVINLNVISDNKKIAVKEKYSLLPEKFQWLNKYYLYAVNVYVASKYNLGYFSIQKDGISTVPGNQPRYLISVQDHVQWVFTEDLNNSGSLRHLINSIINNDA